MGDNDFLDFVLDQLDGLEDVHYRHMFGGVGVYSGEVFFAIVDEGRLYFATSEATKKDYLARGMKAFRPTPDQTLKRYFAVPVDVLEDDRVLSAWAQTAVAVQRERGTRARRRRESKKLEGK